MVRSSTPRPESETFFKPSTSPASAGDLGKLKGVAKREGARETVEAIVVAFIFALLVRGFEAEAFVIPTGSMAPTLMGRHKEVNCPQCGYLYAVNASEEVDGNTGSPTSSRVYSGMCGNCRFQTKVADEPSFKGDRILVLKFLYDMAFLPGSSGPKRWDVVVFRYPEEPEISYIKRLVGLPGETLRIWYGDVFIKGSGSEEFLLERKPMEHQRAMQMMVYDDAHRAKSLEGKAEWRRWTGGAWVEEANKPGTYTATPKGEEWAEIRYRNMVPDPGEWQTIEAGEKLSREPRPTLITDFYSYNTNLGADHSDLSGDVRREQENAWLQPHWVGDLTISGRLDAEGATGSVRLELIEGGVSNRCEIDLATGVATLLHGKAEVGRETMGVKVGRGRHDFEFANVDNKLSLLVDGRSVFGEGRTYEDEPGKHPAPTEADLEPVRVAAKGAKVALSDLVVKRDIYYTLNPGGIDYKNRFDSEFPRNAIELFAMLAEPKRVAALGPLEWVDYPIGVERFMMLGDNSPRSKDSRGWSLADREWDPSGRERWEVPRKMLTGKAFCIYWPHGKPFWPNIKLSPDLWVPFRPYFERMRLIH